MENDSDDDKNASPCVICELHTRQGKHKFCTVLSCKKDYQAAKANSKRQGEEQETAFKKAEQEPELLRKAVLEYARKCPSGGRGSQRASFDFIRFVKRNSEKHSVASQSQHEWMEQEHFVLWQINIRGKLACWPSPLGMRWWLSLKTLCHGGGMAPRRSTAVSLFAC